jgi:ribosomal protein L34E
MKSHITRSARVAQVMTPGSKIVSVVERSD